MEGCCGVLLVGPEETAHRGRVGTRMQGGPEGQVGCLHCVHVSLFACSDPLFLFLDCILGETS